jgi:protein TonB
MAESPLSPAADRALAPSLPSAGPTLPSVEESGEGSSAVLPGEAADIAGDKEEPARIESLGPSASGLRDSGQNSGTAVAAGARNAYAERVRKLIEKYREYPLMARRMRMQGVVLVRCRLTRDGIPLSVEVAAASSYPLLDQAALRAVSCVSSYPPVPPEVEGEVVILEIPLRFSLSEMPAD